MNKRIVVYDFETNGLWNRLTQPIQVHFRVLEPDGRVWEYSEYVSCRWVPYNITLLTGITTDILIERGRPIEEVFGRIKDILFGGDVLLVGHNILRFDNLFLNYYLQKFFTLRYQVGRGQCFDTAAEFKAVKMGLVAPVDLVRGDWHHGVLYTQAKGVTYGLEEACSYYGVEYAGAHTAGGDVEMTHKVFVAQCRAAGIVLPGDDPAPVLDSGKRRKKKKAA